jgi:DNA-directed RNA polymerase I subunit RPA49
VGSHHRYGHPHITTEPLEVDRVLTSTVTPAGFALPTSIPFQPYTKPRARAAQRLVPGSGAIATTELLLHSAHTKLDYTVREEDTLQKHYVGVYDPKTGKLDVTEARKMGVRAVVRAHEATGEQIRQVGLNPEGLYSCANSVQTAAKSRAELAIFGTKKARKALASQTDNAIGPAKAQRPEGTKVTATTAAVMASMADATGGMATAEELQQEADASKPRPQPNLNATDVKDVYTVDSLVGADTLKHIPVMDWVQAIAEEKEIVVNSRYVAHRIQAQASNIEKLKILRYMLLLIDFYLVTRPGRDGGRMLPKRDAVKAALGGVPEAVVESIKRRFAEGGAMPRFKVDLLITHICALACVVDHYEVDMFDLQEDLRLQTAEMSKYFREIGARISALSETQRRTLQLDKATAAQRRVAKLKMPLDFPKVAYARKAAK